MRKDLMHFLPVIILLLLSSCADPVPPQDHHFVLQNVHIIHLDNGQIDSSQYVTIKNDRITGISNSDTASDSTERIDGNGGFLIPGLWDMHTHYHWNYEYSSQMLVANGVTGVREMWGDLSTVKSIRKKSAVQKIIAPDIFTAGALLDGSPPVWRGSEVIDDAEAAREEVADQAEDGADFIKVYSRLSREAYFAIAETSKEKGIPFAGHVPFQVSSWEAADAGQQTIEHMYGLLEAAAVPEQALDEDHGNSYNPENIAYNLDHYDEQKFDSLARHLARNGTAVSPTLVVLRNIAHLDDSDIRKDDRLAYMPEDIHEMWLPENGFPYQDREGFFPLQKQKVAQETALIKRLHDAGVLIVAGTDFPNPFCFPGFSLHDELALYVEGGLTPLEALRTATINAATLMGKEETYGSIDIGKRANLVLLEKNPLIDIRNTESIRMVFLRGNYLDRNALDSLLEESKKYSEDTF